MKLENGKPIYVEEQHVVGIVKDAENNLVTIGDDDVTVDPEFCHKPTVEELEEAGLSGYGENQEASADIVAENTAGEPVSEEQNEDAQLNIPAGVEENHE